MPWIFLNDDEVAILKVGLDREVAFHMACSHIEETKAAQDLRDRLKDAGTPGEDDACYAEGAAGQLSDPDEIEGFPDHPFVSESDDGAYVMAWIWVSKEDAGLEAFCEECSGTWTIDQMSTVRADCCKECERVLDAQEDANE